MNNLNNILLTEQIVNDILKNYIKDFKIRDLSIYQEAMVHKSVVNYNNDPIFDVADEQCCFPKVVTKSYETLEFLGDRIISIPVVDYISRRLTGKKTIRSLVGVYTYNKCSSLSTEGFISKMCSYLERKEQLAKFCEVLNLQKYILLSCHNENLNSRDNDRIKEDVFEAFIGALYIDQGFDKCYELISNLLDKHISFNKITEEPSNYKDMLVRFFHKQVWKHPEYINCTKGINAKNFVSVVALDSKLITDKFEKVFKAYEKTIGNTFSEYSKTFRDISRSGKVIVGVGIGKTKKLSEQDCSKKVLEHFGVPFSL